MNCSFKFKARPVPSSSSTKRLERTKLRLSALKGGDNSVSMVRSCVRACVRVQGVSFGVAALWEE